MNGAAVLLAVTREGSAITVQLGDAEDGVPENAAAYADRHPVTDLVEAVREEVERVPLFGDVTPEGRRLLTGHELPLPTADQWAAWRGRGKDRLLLWPHGALHYLPVALCSADGDGRPIADDWTVTTIAGLESLVPLDIPVRPRRTAGLASATGGVPYGLPAEPALDEHARAVAAAVGGVVVTGPAATRARLFTELATADVVHLAVHGTMDRGAPWLHCLHLAPDDDDDGRVFAHDFLEHDLSGVRLVTLAACESASGRFDRADNVRGVPAALITAGVRAVVGCLRAVRPEPAAYFYHHLHERAAEGESAERAFRAARNATRARYPHYRDWGAFTFLRGRSGILRDGSESLGRERGSRRMTTEIQLHDIALVPERTLGAPSDDGPLRGRLTFGWDLLPADHEGAPAGRSGSYGDTGRPSRTRSGSSAACAACRWSATIRWPRWWSWSPAW
ncbi:CHAT domain-containing protein [Streptomyces bacillaris]|uniref:CHAT domain-containing protein n=1 Tax=Streptomyces bacillaris TaxID=68179 RepID=UPI003809BA04